MTINASQNIMIDPNEPLILPDRTALTGRIEWFLYSLCLLDYENLPTPMSRIEQFANALVTGEVPNIEPQSRVEEYFLAILTGDVENLPEPESRVEVLLNKLARGEFDLSDVEPIQSRYELLIAYLIKNGGMNDVTYVLHEFLASETHYTMYNTQEKPTKSAILKGQTLVNLVPRKIIDHIASSDWDGYCCLVQNSKQSIDQWRTLQDLKPNTKYYISCYVETFEDANNKDYCLNNPSVESIFGDSMIINGVGRYQWLSTTKSELTDEIFIALRSQNAHARGAIKIRDIMIIEYQQGMENWDIPYFEGMQSVKMPVLTTMGKNLFNMNKPYDTITDSQATVIQDTNQITVSSAESGIYVNANFILDKDLLKGKTITGSCLYESDEKDIGTVQITYQDGNGDHHYQWIKTPRTFTFPNSFIGDVMLSISANNTDTPQSNTVTVKNIQLELGSTATSYEPYKSNVLTVNEPIELRGIGDVKDELNLLTGEVVERTGEIVLNGNESWWFADSPDNPENTGTWTHSENTWLLGVDFTTISSNTHPVKNTISDKYPVYYDYSFSDSEYFNIVSNNNSLLFRVRKDRFSDKSITNFKSWLSQNPITIQYQLTTESVKTVDLSILDQDGATVEKLNTFKDITHVSCSVDEGSIYPYVEMEVATSNDEDLAAIGLKLEEKNKVQSKLIKVNDYQSDVIDNVMLGITEIYESI